MNQEQAWHNALSLGQTRAGTSEGPLWLALGWCSLGWRLSSRSWHPKPLWRGGPRPGLRSCCRCSPAKTLGRGSQVSGS